MQPPLQNNKDIYNHHCKTIQKYTTRTAKQTWQIQPPLQNNQDIYNHYYKTIKTYTTTTAKVTLNLRLRDSSLKAKIILANSEIFNVCE